MRSGLSLFVIAVLAAGLARGTAPQLRGALAAIDGGSTITHCRVGADGAINDTATGQAVLRVPPSESEREAKLLGLLSRGNAVEAIFGWTEAPVNYIWKHHFQVFRGNRGATAVLAGRFALEGGPEASVRFYRPPDHRDTPKIVFEVVGGATWSTNYLLASDGSIARKLFESNAYDFIDLNGDGVYELVQWSRRPDDQRCRFGMFEVRVNPSIWVQAGSEYRKVWPPESGWTQVMAKIIEAGTNSTREIVALTDTFAQSSDSQKLAVYRFEHDSFRLVTEALLPWPRIAYWLAVPQSKPGAQIEVWLADAARCEAGGNPEARGTAIATYKLGPAGLTRTGLHRR